MKKQILFLFTLILILQNFSASAQQLTLNNDTLFFAESWNRTDIKDSIAFYGFKNYDNEQKGLAVYYYVTGELHSYQNEKKDLKHGKCTWFYKNGNKRAEGEYHEDKIIGIYVWYNENGEISSTANYGGLEESDEIVDFCDKEAEFNGGATGLQRYISKNFVYPIEAIELGEQGKVFISFVIEKDGSVSNIKIDRGVCESLDNEALRLIRNMPPWSPGETNGLIVRTRVRLPINFTLEEGKKKKIFKK